MAEQQVAAFLTLIQQRYNLTDEEMRVLPHTLHFMIDYRKRLDLWAGWFMKSLVAMVAVGLGMALWEGIKHLINGQQ